MSGEQLEIKLYCWLRGTNANEIFSVTLTRSARARQALKEPDVDDLKQAIARTRATTFKSVDVTALKLYKFSPRETDEEDTVRAELPDITLSDPRLSKLSKGRESLSKIFPEGFDEPDKGYLHIVIDAFELKLHCLMEGKPPRQIFPVKVAAEQDVGALKKAIKTTLSRAFRNTAAIDITLYKVCLRDDDALQGKLNNLQYDKPLRNIQTLSEVFKDVPLQDHLHVVIESPDAEDLDDDLDDDLGVFGSEDIQYDMDGYDIQRVFGHPNVAIAEAENATKGDTRIYLLKYIDEDSKELHILQHLQSLVSPQNHTISTTNSWNVEDGTVIAMPTAGGWLTSLNNPGVQLWSVARQLFEAIAFMHEHGVAHMDIKPGNVIIPPDGGRLTIIDFSASVQVKGPQHMFRGVAGTEGYIAPEVRVKKYSPILADLWSCGKTLEELCGRCLDSTDSRVSSDRTTLLGMAKELMANDPSNRPTMSVLLERMSSIESTKSVETMKSVGSVGSVGSMESAESAEGMESVESAESMESTESMDSTESMERFVLT